MFEYSSEQKLFNLSGHYVTRSAVYLNEKEAVVIPKILF